MLAVQIDRVIEALDEARDFLEQAKDEPDGTNRQIQRAQLGAIKLGNAMLALDSYIQGFEPN